MEQLDSIALFVAVAEAGSFSLVARHRGVSVSSVTRAIATLERVLQTSLLNRSTHRIGLTEAGDAYLLQARRIIDSVQEARAAVADLSREPKGTLRVHAAPAFARRHLSPLMPGLLKKYPGLDIDLSLSNNLADLRDEQIDVAVRLTSFGHDPDLVVRKLVPSAFLLCASPAYLSKHPAITRPADLAGHACLTIRERQRADAWLLRIDAASEPERISVSSRMTTTDAEILLDAARAGCGIILLPEWLVSADLESRTLRRVLPSFEAAFNQFDAHMVAAYLPTMRNSQKVKCFVEHLATQLAKPSAKPAR